MPCGGAYEMMLSALQTLVPPQKVSLKKSKSCAKLVAEVAQKIWKSCVQFGSFLDVKCYFGPLVLWQILAANNKTTSINIKQL